MQQAHLLMCKRTLLINFMRSIGIELNIWDYHTVSCIHRRRMDRRGKNLIRFIVNCKSKVKKVKVIQTSYMMIISDINARVGNIPLPNVEGTEGLSLIHI